ncbi:dynamin family protein [Paractinoplanes rishiriensis]|uniref:Isoniazid inducible gene protein IniA n=1 Tax=Paractinoplanes rishiriensis TaxID=1050105 RepID=A0A919MUP0_9ACTN|nr:dynamin family protein [Actinoplanes rishiriensis]GIE95544.1 isoniazid inducible gene protein IniA [Actinoplanes rishiriensis]
MESWEAGPTAYAGPTSPVRPSRTELGTLTAPPGPASLWLDVLDATIRTCREHGRSDLVAWLWQRRAQLLHPHLRVLVVGAAKQGKSQLINALINAPVCVVGDDRGTTVPTVVRHTATPAAHLIRRAAADAEWTADAGPQDRFPLALDRVADALTETIAGQPAEMVGRLHADVGVPRTLLATGLQLIDTPPLPGLPAAAPAAVGRVRELATDGRADVVLFTCESGRELSDAEVDVLADLGRLYPSLVVVYTKTDYAAHWRRDVEVSRMRLVQAGVPATVVPLSAALRTRAVQTGDTALNGESGFPVLINLLQTMVATKPDRLARQTVGVLGRMVTERLAVPLKDNLDAQRAETSTSHAVTRLHETQRRMDELRKCATRWQSRLADEVADLMSDIEHDLRERTRAVIAHADEVFTESDPLKMWDEFEPWLRDALLDAANSSLAWLGDRAEWLARAVAAEFPPELGDVLPSWVPGVQESAQERVTGLDSPQIERFTMTQKVFTGLRGSYGGVLMFGLATSLAGMSLINPISLGGGALFGGKSIREEGRSLLKRRQAAARVAVRQHVDEIFVGLAKDAKDSMRRIQRALRDHFTAVTEDLQEAIVESLRSAKADAERDLSERESRARRTEQELIRLAALQKQALALLQAPA